jgi:hypothetical protein
MRILPYRTVPLPYLTVKYRGTVLPGTPLAETASRYHVLVSLISSTKNFHIGKLSENLKNIFFCVHQNQRFCYIPCMAKSSGAGLDTTCTHHYLPSF